MYQNIYINNYILKIKKKCLNKLKININQLRMMKSLKLIGHKYLILMKKKRSQKKYKLLNKKQLLNNIISRV
jgi:hypothetical protein